MQSKQDKTENSPCIPCLGVFVKEKPANVVQLSGFLPQSLSRSICEFVFFLVTTTEKRYAYNSTIIKGRICEEISLSCLAFGRAILLLPIYSAGFSECHGDGIARSIPSYS